MLRVTPCLVAAALLVGCASATHQTSAYNMGVEAYRAKDYAAARGHWGRAIEQGEVYAFNNLGYLLYVGLGGPANAAEAVSLWKKGAMAGHSEAQWHLGQAYEEGKGVPQNFVEAYAWFRCAIASAEAASSDDETERTIASDARSSLAKLLPRLTPSQFGESEALAKQYIVRHAKNAGV